MEVIQGHDDKACVGISLPEYIDDEYLRFEKCTIDELESLLQKFWYPCDTPESFGSDEFDLKNFRESLYRALYSINCLYTDYFNNLPVDQLESWYKSEAWMIFFKAQTTYSKPLAFIPGEKCSVASADRMNSSRTNTATRQARGSKTDGLVLSTLGIRIEILVVDVGRFDKGPSGTKLLTEGVISKVMKDQFDYACTTCKWKDIAMDNLQVFEIQVSQFRVDFLSLKRLRDRFYRLTRE
ncbi:hypothetical protein BGX27_001756 [Mortierella sp. AM989]|nr:hypothetical protein BGX27_001756 [Mortierella sp. AM989]